eukprot:m51a1_g5394 putative 40S ribosomal protein S25e (109) ;mRNA; r:41579-42092
MAKDKGDVAKEPKEGGSKHSNKGKKKWSKSKVKEKLNNMVLLDKATLDKINKEVPQWKLITISLVSDRLKINGSLARHVIDDLVARGVIRPVVKHHAIGVYTRASAEK